MNTLHICFHGQGIHFWGYFCDLTSKPQNRGQNDPFWGQNWTKIYFFWISFWASHKRCTVNQKIWVCRQEKVVIEMFLQNVCKSNHFKVTGFAVKSKNMILNKIWILFKNDKIKFTSLKIKCELSTHMFFGSRNPFLGLFLWFDL